MTRFLNLPAAPILLPGVGGSADPAAALRRLCQWAADRELADTSGRVLIIAAGETTRRWDRSVPYDLARLTGRRRTTVDCGPARTETGLPLPLAVVRQFFVPTTQAGSERGPELILLTVASRTPPDRCGDLIDQLGVTDDDLVVAAADGSALSRPGGPDVIHPEAADFDHAVTTAWGSGDPAALAGIDTGLADTVRATGGPVWPLLAALSTGHRYRSTVDYADTPFGVFCLIAAWDRLESDHAARANEPTST